MNWTDDKTIVVPVDFSDESINAVKFVEQITSDEQEIHILHVAVDLDATTYPGILGNPIDDDLRKREAKEKLIDALSNVVSDSASLEVRVGDPGHAIVDFADQIGADLIVLPSHGRSGMARVLLGSVAERVVRHAHCPVLVLKPEKKKGALPTEKTASSSTDDSEGIGSLREVYSTDDPNYAELLRNSLNGEGIKCEVTGESQGGFAGLTSFPIKILVRAVDFDRARKYIETHHPK